MLFVFNLPMPFSATLTNTVNLSLKRKIAPYLVNRRLVSLLFLMKFCRVG